MNMNICAWPSATRHALDQAAICASTRPMRTCAAQQPLFARSLHREAPVGAVGACVVVVEEEAGSHGSREKGGEEAGGIDSSRRPVLGPSDRQTARVSCPRGFPGR